MTFRFQDAFRRLADVLLRRAPLVLGLLLASLVGSLVIATRLEFDFTPQSIYRGDDDLVAYAEEFRKTFGYDEAVVLVVLEATGTEDALSSPALRWQADVAADLAGAPGVERVVSLPTVQIPRLTLTAAEVRPLLEGDAIDDAAAESVRGWIADESLVRSGLLSQDDSVAAVPVFLDPLGRDIETMRQSVAAIREILARHAAPEGFRVHLSGLPVLRVEVVNNLRADLLRLMPLAGLVYLLLLGLMYRSVKGAVLPLAAVGLGVAWTLATFTLVGESMNVVSNVLPILLVIIGVSSSVQIVNCYGEEAARHPHDRLRAAAAAIAHMAPVCLLAGITTAIGFASLATARSVLLRHFAWQAAIGIAFQYVSTLIALGTLFRWFAPPRRPVHKSEGEDSLRGRSRTDWIGAAVGRIGVAVSRNPRKTVVVAVGIVAAALLAGSRVSINSQAIFETFPEDAPSVRTLRLVEDHLAGIMPLDISLEAERPGCFLDPEVFHKVREVEQAARAMPGVLVVQSYADLFREVLSHWPGRRVSEADRELVPEGEAGWSRLERVAKFVDRFRDAFHADSFVTRDGRRARIRIRLKEIGSRETLVMIESLEKTLAATFPPGGCIKARLTGEAHVNARALTTLIGDLYRSLLTASFVIFGLIALEFRSLRVGLIAALPNLTPLAVTLGYMGLRGYDMNVGNVIVFTISLGLADDNTIHFLYRFREELHATGAVRGAIRRAFLGTGRAILATSLLLLAGMAVLLFSNFVPTRRFAELTAVTILGNLLGILLLLPACLVLFWKREPVN